MNPTSAPSWWNRNAKWAVPVVVLAVMLALAAFAFGIVSFVEALMTSSEPYVEAVARARGNADVNAALGTPIEAGFFTSGSFKTNGTSGHASLSIPLQGPRGKARLYVEARMQAARWTYSTLTVELQPDGRRIDLNP